MKKHVEADRECYNPTTNEVGDSIGNFGIKSRLRRISRHTTRES